MQRFAVSVVGKGEPERRRVRRGLVRLLMLITISLPSYLDSESSTNPGSADTTAVDDRLCLNRLLKLAPRIAN